MIKAPINLQDLRRRIYVKAKSEPSWRFWGLYVHVCKTEVLHAAYRLAKKNHGSPGIDGVTFKAVEANGVEQFVEELRKELVDRTYRPLRARKVEIPKEGGKVRRLSIPAIRDRVVQGALKLVLNRSSRRTSNRGRSATGQRGQPMTRINAWRMRSSKARHRSSTSICGPTSITCDTTSY